MLPCNETLISASFPDDCAEAENDLTCKQFCRRMYCMARNLPAAIVIAVLSFYVLLAILAYEWQRRKETVLLTNRLYIVSIVCCFGAAIGDVMLITATNFSCTALHTIVVVFRVLSTLIGDVMLITATNFSCTALHTIVVVFWVLSTLIAYVTIWTRHRRFYTDPLFTDSTRNIHRAVSVAVLVTIIVSLPAGAVTCFIQHRVQPTYYGCVNHWFQENFFEKTTTVFAVVFSLMEVSSQLLLLALTVLPLIAQRQRNSNKLFPRISQGREVKEDIRRLVKRLVLCTCVYFVSGLGSTVLVVLSFKGVICFYINTCILLNVLVTNIATVCSFSDGWLRLMPWRKLLA